MCDLSGTMGKDREKRVQEQTGIALFSHLILPGRILSSTKIQKEGRSDKDKTKFSPSAPAEPRKGSSKSCKS